MAVVIKVVPKKAAPINTGDGTKKITVRKAPKEGAEPVEPPKQRFLATHSEKSTTVKFGNMQFGAMRGEAGGSLESFMRGNENKDTAKIQSIIAIIKTYMKGGIAYDKICERLNKTQTEGAYAQTLQVYLNHVSKKPETVEAPAESVAKIIYEGNTANEHGDDDHGLDLDSHGHLLLGADKHWDSGILNRQEKPIK